MLLRQARHADNAILEAEIELAHAHKLLVIRASYR
jgi:hypothetical protein